MNLRSVLGMGRSADRPPIPDRPPLLLRPLVSEIEALPELKRLGIRFRVAYKRNAQGKHVIAVILE